MGKGSVKTISRQLERAEERYIEARAGVGGCEKKRRIIKEKKAVIGK
jgi:hypothetical protein